MEYQLKELIERIKNDGVKDAEDNAARIISEAQQQATTIVKNAEEEARQIRTSAMSDAERAERSGAESLRQAARDLLLTVRESIEKIFDKIITAEVSRSLDQQLMTEAILAGVKCIKTDASGSIDVQIPESQYASLEPGLRGALAAEFAQGISIVPLKGLDAGFRISMKDGSAFYEFSNQELAAMLSRYLNPRLGKFLSE